MRSKKILKKVSELFAGNYLSCIFVLSITTTNNLVMTKQEITIDVVRSQCYFTVRDGGSYQYFYSQTPPTLNTAYDVWCNLVKGPDEAKEKFFAYINSGKNPDYSDEIRWAKQWLAEHGHKTGDWASAIKQKKEAIVFMEGGWKSFVRLITPVKVRYNVTTDRAYNGKSNYDKWMPNRPEDKFVHIEEGYFF